MKFLCEQCKAKYQIADEKAAGKMVRMKCRKCGHLIEVRATVGDAIAPSAEEPLGPAAASEAPAPRPKPPQKPAGLPPRPSPLAGNVGAQRAPNRPDAPSSVLAGAFRSSMQRDEEVSAPIDMSDLSPSDEWYVAINGVPVGPVLVAEVRRKAALGAVNEDSLVWQEGLDEWRPLRSFPDLAASVREVMSTGRSSLLPAPLEGRTSNLPPRSASARPPPSSAVSARPSPPPRPPSRTNVVPFVARLATAEKLEEPREEGSGAARVAARTAAPSFDPDPFGTPPAPAVAAPEPFVPSPAPAAALTSASRASAAPADWPAKQGPPWIAIAMVAAAVAFGVTAAVAIFFRPAPPPQVTVAQNPAVAVPAAPTPVAPASAPRHAEPTDLPAVAAPPGLKAAAGAQKSNASTAPSSSTSSGTARSLDLHSLTQNAPTVTPLEDPAGDGPKAPGQCFSEGQVQQVIGLHQTAIRRACWERNPTPKLTVNVSVTMTIANDGSAQSVVASGDEASVAKCIENDVRGWRFPAMGCNQKTGFSLKFVRQ